VLHAEELAAARASAMRLAGFVFGRTIFHARPGSDAAGARRSVPDHPLHSPPAPTARNPRWPYSDFSNFNGFGQECTQGRDLGFDGKTLIHPGRSRPAMRSSRRRRRSSHARKIIAAFERLKCSRGAIQLDGQMVERLHADIARVRLRSPMRSRRWAADSSDYWKSRRIMQTDQEQRGDAMTTAGKCGPGEPRSSFKVHLRARR